MFNFYKREGKMGTQENFFRVQIESLFSFCGSCCRGHARLVMKIYLGGLVEKKTCVLRIFQGFIYL